MSERSPYPPNSQYFSWRTGLRFGDASLEVAFWQRLFERRRRTILISIAVIMVGLLMATSAAVWLSSRGPAHASGAADAQALFGIGAVPAVTIILLVLGSFILIGAELRITQGCSYREVTGFVVVVAALVGVGYALLMMLNSPDDIQFFTYAFLHVLVFSGVLMLIPVSFLLFLSPSLCAVFGVMLFAHSPEVPAAELSFYLQQAVSICLLTIYVAYTLEAGARQTFLFERQLRLEHARREQDQVKRLDWIGFIAQFLRHEFRNALLGVASSLELLKRRAEPGRNLRPIEEALVRAGGIRRSLDQAAEASALEAKLLTIEARAIDMQSLLCDLVPAYGEYQGRLLLHETSSCGSLALADDESLAQAFSMLLEIFACMGESPPDILASLEQSRDLLVITICCEDVPTDLASGFAVQVVQLERDSVPNGPFGVQLFMIRRIIQVLDGHFAVDYCGESSSLQVTVTLPAA